MGAMFKQIGKAHGVRPAKVFESLGRNPAGNDLAVTRPFILWYGFAATVMAVTSGAAILPRMVGRWA